VSLIEQKLRDLEKILGKGESFSPTERNLVLRHGCPPWLVLGSKFAKGKLAERCENALEALSKLYDDVIPALPELLRPRND
jgi:hypothetical protein